jgi:hypothetical protein
MTDAAPKNCGECVYWTRLRAEDGVCRRHAPATAARANEVAHWPLTHIRQVCGEGLVAVVRPGSTCPACLYWRRHATGLQPMDRGDMLKDWWARAGFCLRFAPEPSAEPGPRAFWRATGDEDGCGDGAPSGLEP